MHFVSFSAVTWNFPLIGRTRMLAEAWRQMGVPTSFVQAPYLRSALERIWPFGRKPEPLPVLRPWPTYPRRWWLRVGAERLRTSIRRRARGLRRQLDKLLSWEDATAVVVSPVWVPWLEVLPFRHVIYDCIDAVEVHLPRAELAPLYEDWEAELIARCDGAVVTAEDLGATLRDRRPELPLTTIRNGVDVDRFQWLAANTARPTDLPDRGRPLIGFVGVMAGGATYEWLDWELLIQVVQALPEFDFVFIGPHDEQAHVHALRAAPNAYLLGWRPYDQVPAYMQAFTACWVPFSQGVVGRSANPVKIYEYLALGKPVVTTPVSDTQAFGNVVVTAATVDEMMAALRMAVSEGRTGAQARIAYARANSWEARARAFMEFVTTLNHA
ncbi:MAG: glycosyltransferase [Planctomycetota bacterium]